MVNGSIPLLVQIMLAKTVAPLTEIECIYFTRSLSHRIETSSDKSSARSATRTSFFEKVQRTRLISLALVLRTGEWQAGDVGRSALWYHTASLDCHCLKLKCRHALQTHESRRRQPCGWGLYLFNWLVFTYLYGPIFFGWKVLSSYLRGSNLFWNFGHLTRGCSYSTGCLITSRTWVGLT